MQSSKEDVVRADETIYVQYRRLSALRQHTCAAIAALTEGDKDWETAERLWQDDQRCQKQAKNSAPSGSDLPDVLGAEAEGASYLTLPSISAEASNRLCCSPAFENRPDSDDDETEYTDDTETEHSDGIDQAVQEHWRRFVDQIYFGPDCEGSIDSDLSKSYRKVFNVLKEDQPCCNLSPFGAQFFQLQAPAASSQSKRTQLGKLPPDTSIFDVYMTKLKELSDGMNRASAIWNLPKIFKHHLDLHPEWRQLGSEWQKQCEYCHVSWGDGHGDDTYENASSCSSCLTRFVTLLNDLAEKRRKDQTTDDLPAKLAKTMTEYPFKQQKYANLGDREIARWEVTRSNTNTMIQYSFTADGGVMDRLKFESLLDMVGMPPRSDLRECLFSYTDKDKSQGIDLFELFTAICAMYNVVKQQEVKRDDDEDEVEKSFEFGRDGGKPPKAPADDKEKKYEMLLCEMFGAGASSIRSGDSKLELRQIKSILQLCIDHSKPGSDQRTKAEEAMHLAERSELDSGLEDLKVLFFGCVNSAVEAQQPVAKETYQKLQESIEHPNEKKNTTEIIRELLENDYQVQIREIGKIWFYAKQLRCFFLKRTSKGFVTKAIGERAQKRADFLIKLLQQPLEEKFENGTSLINKERTGVAFSGGGGRAAAEAFGFLHAITTRNVQPEHPTTRFDLSQVDFISTVSGGGFCGTGLTSWFASKYKEKDEEKMTEKVKVWTNKAQVKKDKAKKEAKSAFDKLNDRLKPTSEAKPRLSTNGDNNDLDNWLSEDKDAKAKVEKALSDLVARPTEDHELVQEQLEEQLAEATNEFKKAKNSMERVNKPEWLLKYNQNHKSQSPFHRVVVEAASQAYGKIGKGGFLCQPYGRVALIFVLMVATNTSYFGFLSYTFYFQQIVILRAMGIGEDYDIVVLIAFILQFAMLDHLCGFVDDYARHLCRNKLIPPVLMLASIGFSCAIYFLCFSSTNHQMAGIVQSSVFSFFAATLMCYCSYATKQDAVSLQDGPVGLRAFGRGLHQCFSIITNLLIVGLFGYTVYRVNPHMNFLLHVDILNSSIPFEALLLMLSPLFHVIKCVLISSTHFEINSLYGCFIVSLGEYVQFRSLSLFYYLCVPLLKDFRCEIVQDSGHQSYCSFPPCDANNTDCFPYSDMYNAATSCTAILSAACNSTIGTRECYMCENEVAITEDVDLDTWKFLFAPIMLACIGMQIMPSILGELLVSPLSWSWQAENEDIYLHEDSKEPQQTSCDSKLTSWIVPKLCGGKQVGSKTFNKVRHTLMENGAPLLINNMGQHSLSLLTNLGEIPHQSYNLFETTPLSWGSADVGYKPHHPDEASTAASKLSLGTCMQISCAASSGQTGNQLKHLSKEVENIVTGIQHFLGLESGRFLRWAQPKNTVMLDTGPFFHLLMLGACALQILAVRYNCDAVKKAEFQEWHDWKLSVSFPGGYDCMQRGNLVPILGIIMWSVGIVGLILAILAPLRMRFHGWYEFFLFWPPVAAYLRSIKHWSCIVPVSERKEADDDTIQCCRGSGSSGQRVGSSESCSREHGNPQQIFVADGGHYENLGVLPLLRRKCTRICVMDSSASREEASLTMDHMLTLAEVDADTKIWLGSSMFDELVLTKGLDDFYLPRCVIDIYAWRLDEGKSIKSSPRYQSIRSFCHEKIIWLQGLKDTITGVSHIRQDPILADQLYLYFNQKSMNLAHDEISRCASLSVNVLSKYLIKSPVCEMHHLRRYIKKKDLQDCLNADDLKQMFSDSSGRSVRGCCIFQFKLKKTIAEAFNIDDSKIVRCFWKDCECRDCYTRPGHHSKCQCRRCSNPADSAGSEPKFDSILGEHLMIELSNNQTAERVTKMCNRWGLEVWKSLLVTCTERLTLKKQSKKTLYRGSVKSFLESLREILCRCSLKACTLPQSSRDRDSHDDEKFNSLLRELSTLPLLLGKVHTAGKPSKSKNKLLDSEIEQQAGYVPAAVLYFVDDGWAHQFSEKEKKPQHGMRRGNIYRYLDSKDCTEIQWHYGWALKYSYRNILHLKVSKFDTHDFGRTVPALITMCQASTFVDTSFAKNSEQSTKTEIAIVQGELSCQECETTTEAHYEDMFPDGHVGHVGTLCLMALILCALVAFCVISRNNSDYNITVYVLLGALFVTALIFFWLYAQNLPPLLKLMIAGKFPSHGTLACEALGGYTKREYLSYMGFAKNAAEGLQTIFTPRGDATVTLNLLSQSKGYIENWTTYTTLEVDGVRLSAAEDIKRAKKAIQLSKMLAQDTASSKALLLLDSLRELSDGSALVLEAKKQIEEEDEEVDVVLEANIEIEEEDEDEEVDDNEEENDAEKAVGPAEAKGLSPAEVSLEDQIGRTKMTSMLDSLGRTKIDQENLSTVFSQTNQNPTLEYWPFLIAEALKSEIYDAKRQSILETALGDSDRGVVLLAALVSTTGEHYKSEEDWIEIERWWQEQEERKKEERKKKKDSETRSDAEDQSRKSDWMYQVMQNRKCKLKWIQKWLQDMNPNVLAMTLNAMPRLGRSLLLDSMSEDHDLRAKVHAELKSINPKRTFASLKWIPPFDEMRVTGDIGNNRSEEGSRSEEVTASGTGDNETEAKKAAAEAFMKHGLSGGAQRLETSISWRRLETGSEDEFEGYNGVAEGTETEQLQQTEPQDGCAGIIESPLWLLFEKIDLVDIMKPRYNVADFGGMSRADIAGVTKNSKQEEVKDEQYYLLETGTQSLYKMGDKYFDKIFHKEESSIKDPHKFNRDEKEKYPLWQRAIEQNMKMYQRKKEKFHVLIKVTERVMELLWAKFENSIGEFKSSDMLYGAEGLDANPRKMLPKQAELTEFLTESVERDPITFKIERRLKEKIFARKVGFKEKILITQCDHGTDFDDEKHQVFVFEGPRFSGEQTDERTTMFVKIDDYFKIECAKKDSKNAVGRDIKEGQIVQVTEHGLEAVERNFGNELKPKGDPKGPYEWGKYTECF